MGESGRPTSSRNAASPSSPCSSAASATSGQRAGEQDGRAHGRQRHAGGLRHRVGDDAGLRALPQLAADEPCEQVLLRRGGPREQLAQQSPARGGGAGARHLAERREGGVDLLEAEARGVGRVGQPGQGAVPHTGAPLPQLARQVAHREAHLARCRAPQDVRERGGLARAGRLGRDERAGVREVDQPHADAGPPACSSTGSSLVATILPWPVSTPSMCAESPGRVASGRRGEADPLSEHH